MSPSPSPSPAITSRRLIVALDYGTSNSGAAYALFDTATRDTTQVDIEVISDWPHGGTNRSDKVPSDIVYDAATRLPTRFGFDAANDTSALQWVKLLLEPDDLKNKDPDSSDTSRLWKSYEALDVKHLDKQPVDAVADYLTWLWGQTKAKIQENEDDGDIFDAAALTVVLTVPASWRERAKYSMLQAAKTAGISENAIKLISEPEAAAIYSLRRQAKKGQLKMGDCVIVCDAGGGTVDTVSFQVRSVDPLSIDQITMPKASFCGSVFVNAEFHNQVRLMLGKDYELLSSEAKARIDEEFEYKIKRAFHPEETKEYFVPMTGLADDPERNICDGKMKLDNSILDMAFGSVMTPIMTLLDEQSDVLRAKGLSDNLKAILLVGGFSGSDYLHSMVRQYFPNKSDTKIWRSDKTWTAVVQGAVACELSGSDSVAVVHSRLSSYNYGIPYATSSGRKVHWLVRKGQPVEANMATEPYGLRIDDQEWLDEDTHCHIMVPLVRSEEEQASDEYGSLVSPHAEIDCKVPTSIRYSKDAKLVQELPKKAWHVPADLVLFFDGAVISFRCRVKGEEVGVTNVHWYQSETNRHRASVLSSLSVPSVDSCVDSVFSATSETTSPIVPEDYTGKPCSTKTKWRVAVKVGTWIGSISTKRDPAKDKSKKPSVGRKDSSTSSLSHDSSQSSRNLKPINIDELSRGAWSAREQAYADIFLSGR